MPEKEKRAGTPAPYCLAMLACDGIHIDPSTGKRTLLGCFAELEVAEFPAAHTFLCVYVVLSEGRGLVPVTLRLVDVDEDRPPAFELQSEARFADPKEVVEMDLFADDFVLPKPGEYRLQLLVGMHPVMERRIVVFLVGGHGNGPNAEE